jgi:hypothetical protein
MQIVLLLFFLCIFKQHLLPSVRMVVRPTAYGDAAVEVAVVHRCFSLEEHSFAADAFWEVAVAKDALEEDSVV